VKPKPNSFALLGQLVGIIDAMTDERAILSAQQVIGDRLSTVQSARVDAANPAPKRTYTRRNTAPKPDPAPPSITTPAAAGGADDPLAGPWRTAKDHMLIIARSGVAQVSKSAFESGIAKWVFRMDKAEGLIPAADRLAVAKAMADDRFDYANGKIVEGAAT
jgi:hypothetical protein